MYGLAGSGKSTHARRLQAKRPTLRFTLDEWMIRLYPGMSVENSAYGVQAEGVRELIWDLAAQALRLGLDVILDWNFWSTERREWAVRHAQDAGADVELHWLVAGPEEATARAQRRAAEGTGYFHETRPDGNAHLAALMQPPCESEGLTITRV
jgi:predicted kinase